MQIYLIDIMRTFFGLVVFMRESGYHKRNNIRTIVNDGEEKG
jgi:hypothetical protein